MRNLKKIVSIALSTAVMLSTVAFADAPDSMKVQQYSMFVDAATIEQGTTEFTINVGIKDTTGATIDIPLDTAADTSSMFYASLSDEAKEAGIKAVEVTSSIATVVEPDCGGGEYFGCNIAFDKSDVALNSSTPILTVKFTAPADIALGSYKLLESDGEYDLLQLYDKDGNDTGVVMWGDDVVFVTVTAAGGQGGGNTVTAKDAVTGGDGVTAYTIEGDANVSKVITKTFENVTITEATRVKVVWEGVDERQFGSDLYDVLGGIEIGKLTFGIIVDGNAVASDFTTFEIVNQ